MGGSKICHKILKSLKTYYFFWFILPKTSLNKFRNFKQILITLSIFQKLYRCTLIETMLDHVTVAFSYATAVVLNLKTQFVNIKSGFKG